MMLNLPNSHFVQFLRHKISPLIAGVWFVIRYFGSYFFLLTEEMEIIYEKKIDVCSPMHKKRKRIFFSVGVSQIIEKDSY